MSANQVRHRARLVKRYGAPLKVRGNEGRLLQVFVNLIVNAAQAMHVGSAQTNEIVLTTSRDATGSALIEVADTGPGMAATVARRIFDPFFTTKQVGSGMGLGLYISRNIVTGLGGDITVESTEGVGTTFRVVLPVAESERPPATSSPPVPSSRSSHRRGRILVVDDEPLMRASLARLLVVHHVTEAASGREAIELVEREPPFDVILCDLMMPEVSGMEVFQRLQALGLEERLVFMTGGTGSEAVQRFLHEVGNARIEKPFESARILALVDERMGR
jgi:CheY-like chemotaxis protein